MDSMLNVKCGALKTSNSYPFTIGMCDFPFSITIGVPAAARIMYSSIA